LFKTRREKLIYLAGILDGEGSIVLWSNKSPNNIRGKYNLRIYISSTDKILIDWIHSNFGGHTYVNKAPSRKKHWKQAYLWVIDRPNMFRFLKEICPFLLIKKERCEIAIKFRETFEKRERPVSKETLELRQLYVNQMTQLNLRGC